MMRGLATNGVFFMMLLLVQGQALAHVSDTDELSMLPLGTKLEVRQEVNIKPSHTSTYFVSGEVASGWTLGLAGSRCYLAHTSSPQDRRLEAGTTLVLGKPEVWERNRQGTELWVVAKVTNSEEITHLGCEIKPRIAALRPLTIADLQNNMKGLFEVTFPPPVPIRISPQKKDFDGLMEKARQDVERLER